MKQTKHKPEELNVTESITLLILVAIFFFTIFWYFITYNLDGNIIAYVLWLACMPLFLMLFWKRSKKVIISINQQGIFSHGKLVTDWYHFQNVEIKQLPLRIGQINDNVVMIIRFLNEERNMLYEQKLKLSNTLNKSEEQMLRAIEFFKKK